MAHCRGRSVDKIFAMKQFLPWLVGLVLALGVVGMPQTAHAAGAAAATTKADGKNAAGTAGVPGAEQMARMISTVTGVAISPLLGMGAVGAWEYFRWQKLPERERGPLPWYANPLFWLPALLVVGLIGAKDVLGTAAPSALKKPFDIAELIENKISGLIAAGLFIPIATSLFSQHPTTSAFAGMHVAVIDASAFWNVLLVPVAVVTFAVVWLVSHAIHVLILISPFTTVDTALKSARLFLLSTVTVTAFSNPWVGAAWSLVLIFAAYLLAGWSFRLMCFGAVYSWDFFTLRNGRFTLDAVSNKMFTAEKIGKTPIRTYGRLVKEDGGKLVFHHRPWLVLPPQRLELPAGRYVVGRGLIYSEVRITEGTGGASQPVLVLPPRYRSHEETLAQIYGLAGVADVGLRKGLRTVWDFLRGNASPAPA